MIDQVIYMPIESPVCNSGWDYASHGMDWECKCSEGTNQSPINLPNKLSLKEVDHQALFLMDLVPKSQMSFIWEDNMAKLKGRFGTINDPSGAEFEAYEIRFHSPAEHTLQGKRYDMEIQIMHKPITEGDFFKTAVVSFFVEGNSGVYNKFFDTFDPLNLPDRFNSEVRMDSTISYEWLFVDDENSIKDTAFSYFTYVGSRTTPQCNEFTTWYIAEKPIQVSSSLLSMFSESLNVNLEGADESTLGGAVTNNAMHDALEEFYGSEGNYREIQPLNNREIRFFDVTESCDYVADLTLESTQTQQQASHYERVKTDALRYIFVEDNQPSGLKGSFVVSEKEALNKLE